MKVSLRLVLCLALFVYFWLFGLGLSIAHAQLPMGVPDLCALDPQCQVIAAGQTQTISAPIDIPNTIGVKGTLNINAKIGKVKAILLYEGGRLNVNPGGGVSFLCAPFDHATDPEERGCGLIAVGGTLRMNGTVKTAFVRLSAEVTAGTTTIALSAQVQGWSVGDRLVLPDTRQERTDSQSEEVTIAAINGTAITLTEATKFSHAGARLPDGTLKFLPHVANLTRDIVFRSEQPNGVRAHVFITGQTDADIRGAEFVDMGRTLAVPPSDPTFVIGAYALHFHHLRGPATPQANGKQFTVTNVSIHGFKKWGIAIHNSHWGLVKDSVVYDGQGAGIVTEDGSETANQLIGNFVAKVNNFGQFDGSDFEDPHMRLGGCYVFRAANQELRDSVCADTREGIDYLLGATEEAPFFAQQKVRVPKSQGVDTHDDVNVTVMHIMDRARLANDNNEVYAATRYGLGCWVCGVVNALDAPMTNLRIWHTGTGDSINEKHAGIIGKYNDFKISGLTMVNEGGKGLAIAQFNPAFSLKSEPPVLPSLIENADIRGYELGWGRVGQLGQARWWELRNVTFQTVIGAAFNNYGQTTLNHPEFNFKNVKFDPLPNLPLRAVETTFIAADLLPRVFTIRLESYQGDATKNYQLYFLQPTGGEGPAPCTTTMAGFVGFVCPLSGNVPPPPPEEKCGDKIDNDGDGMIDEGCPIEPPQPLPVNPCTADPLKPVVTKWPASQTKSTSGTWNPNGKKLVTAQFLWGPQRFVAADDRGCTATVTK